MTEARAGTFIDIVFDGPPGPAAGRFVEVESPPGKGISFGEWLQRPDGYWVLRLDQALAGAGMEADRILRELVDAEVGYHEPQEYDSKANKLARERYENAQKAARVYAANIALIPEVAGGAVQNAAPGEGRLVQMYDAILGSWIARPLSKVPDGATIKWRKYAD